MKNQNENYWKEFYKTDHHIDSESHFARAVYQYVLEHKLTDRPLVDIACGNGRDAKFFACHGCQVTAIDKFGVVEHPAVNFRRVDMFDFDFTGYELIYLRFVLHTLTEGETDRLFAKLHTTAKSARIFIETRSIRGIGVGDKMETNLKLAVGDRHYRMLYSYDYLTDKVSRRFRIAHATEGKDLAPFKHENPYVIRYILCCD